MANADKKITWTPDQIQEHIQTAEKFIEKHRSQSKSENFTAITREQLEKKFERINSPYISSQGWGGASPGGTFNYSIGIVNPDPFQAIWIFAHTWVGSGNVDPVVGTYLSNVDGRFPRLTEPKFAGLQLPAGGSAVLSFSIKVPAGVEKSNYLGNTCLMRVNWHEQGLELDRSTYVFNVA